ncbi:MAG: YegS/Rv2252/BmrU family lipid kinase [Bacteroidia bacterium]|nr:YegS/Rv2252/BmrU family lipid kinase [Bacteroidia bacterium]
MKTLFLINPGSGRKRNSEKTSQLIHDVYSQAGASFETQIIDFENLDKTLETAIRKGFDHIFAVGGDGTVNAVGAKLIHKPVNFGVIPKGSGNGYARNLGFSTNTRLAIEQSLYATPIRVDTGLFNEQIFLNVAGVGLEAEVAKHFSLGKNRGFVPYAKSSAHRLFAYQPEDYTLSIDGKIQVFHKIMGIAIANGTQWGYDAKISPDARITDGMLDLIIIHKFPLLKAGLIVGKLFSGQFQDSRYVEIYKARTIEITRANAGPAQIDGEPVEAGRNISIRIVDKSLNVLLPNTLTEKKIDSL